MMRHLTAGEIQLAQTMFQDAIDYAAVKLAFGRWWQTFSQVAVAPNGCVYFPRKARCDDFSLTAPHLQMWFMHEMTHVWQYQRGFSVLKSGVMLFVRRGYAHAKAYRYLQDASDAIAPFEQLNMEQQAEVVSHYFAAKYLHVPSLQARLPMLEASLSCFLQQPYWLGLLPKHSRCLKPMN